MITVIARQASEASQRSTPSALASGDDPHYVIATRPSQDIRGSNLLALTSGDDPHYVIATRPSQDIRGSNPLALTTLLILALLPTTSAAQVDPAPRVIKSHFTAKQQQVDRYVNVPFDVPAGTTRVEVDLKYDRAGGENVIDLGLLEPGSLALGTHTFRGWTGGERSSIFVSAVDATPGYWPGPIQAGTWRVGLGLYKVRSAGVDVEVTVRLSAHPVIAVMPSLPLRPTVPIRSGPGWYSGALHAHTHNSDGALSAQALATRARAEGLDFLAITDHNNTAHQREAIDVPGLLTIVGEEVTTPGGHMNAWGLGGMRDFIDFRVSPGDPAIFILVKGATANGALVGINHPYASCFACSWTHPVPDEVSVIEISGREPEEMPRAIAMWDMLLRQGRRVTAIGVSDWHRGEAPLGAASVRVWATELSTRAILDSIRKGRVVVMVDAATPPPVVVVRAGDREVAIGDELTLKPGDPFTVVIGTDAPLFAGALAELVWNGERVSTAPLVSGRATFDRFASHSGYLRVHLLAATGAPLAVTNPIWIRTAPRDAR